MTSSLFNHCLREALMKHRNIYLGCVSCYEGNPDCFNNIFSGLEGGTKLIGCTIFSDMTEKISTKNKAIELPN